MNGRLYDPKLHRFLQTDNYVQDPGNTQNYNRYGYVLNNPLKYTDPSGWLTQEEEKLQAQRAAEERMKAGKSMADWYGQHSGVGPDGLTNEQWMNLGGQGVLSPLYNSYINQNQDRFNSALNYAMQQMGNNNETSNPPFRLRHLLGPDALYIAGAEDLGIGVGVGFEQGALIILRGSDKGIYPALDFGIGLSTASGSLSAEAVNLYYSGDTVTKDVFYGNRYEANFGADALGHVGITGVYAPMNDGNMVWGYGVSLGVGFSATIISGNINSGRTQTNGNNIIPNLINKK